MKMLGTTIILFLASIGAAGAAGITTESLNYTVDGVTMRGYLAYPAGLTGRHPGVLVVHEWMGLNAYAKHRAEQLAALGYVALAADMYGEGKVAKDTDEAGKLAGALKAGDRSLMRKRAAAALAALKTCPHADPDRVAAIGYCFGGTVVLELARSGADLRGVVSFHGGLDLSTAPDVHPIRAAVLVCHGADDPYNPKTVVDAFQDEMRKAGADWQMVFYGGAVHSFTNPDSGSDKSKGVAYDPKADRRSWDLMRSFLAEQFGEIRN